MEPILVTSAFVALTSAMILSFWRAARRGDVIARWDASTTFVVLVAGVLIRLFGHSVGVMG